MISNKFGIEIFYTAFKQACGDDWDKVTQYGILDSSKFFYAITLLSKVIYAHENDSFEAMFSNMLVDKNLNSNEMPIGGRLPKTDPETSEAMMQIFSGQTIQVNLAYLDQLKKLYTNNIHTN